MRWKLKMNVLAAGVVAICLAMAAPLKANAQWGSCGVSANTGFGVPGGIVIQRRTPGFSLSFSTGSYSRNHASHYGGYGDAFNYGLYGNRYGSSYGRGLGTYFGNGAHDLQPHWHSTQTPSGSYFWYGNGPHDTAPHQHTVTPWSTESHSNTAAGPTTSYNGIPAF